MARHKHAVEALQRVILRGGHFMLTTMSDLLVPQPWAVDAQGHILGHVLTVNDAVFDQVAEDCMVETWPLYEALAQSWADLAQRKDWSRAYTEALEVIASDARDLDAALQEQAALQRHGEGMASRLADGSERP